MKKQGTKTKQADQPTITDAVLKEIRAQAADYCNSLELGDSPVDQIARRWLTVGWIAGVTTLLRQEATGKYLELINQEKAARHRRARERKNLVLKRSGS